MILLLRQVATFYRGRVQAFTQLSNIRMIDARVCQSAEAMVRRSKSLQWMGMGVEVGITRLPHSQ